MGEALTLQLSGTRGNLDIHSIYAPTGNQRYPGMSLFARLVEVRTKISYLVRPSSSVLTLIGGDFNYVTRIEDRFSMSSASWSRVDDSRDEGHWNEVMGSNKDLHELHQPMATHEDAHVRSRLDRIYISQHLSNQLDVSLGCAPLEWDRTLSNHRPVIFFRRKGMPKTPRAGSLPTGPIKLNSWPSKVYLAYEELLRNKAWGNPCSAYSFSSVP